MPTLVSGNDYTINVNVASAGQYRLCLALGNANAMLVGTGANVVTVAAVTGVSPSALPVTTTDAVTFSLSGSQLNAAGLAYAAKVVPGSSGCGAAGAVPVDTVSVTSATQLTLTINAGASSAIAVGANTVCVQFYASGAFVNVATLNGVAMSSVLLTPTGAAAVPVSDGARAITVTGAALSASDVYSIVTAPTTSYRWAQLPARITTG